MIELEHVTKRFLSKHVVSDLSFSASKGEVLGFLGPNGAGKSTTMKMITGFLKPSSGLIKVAGYDIQKNAIKAKLCIGYLPEGAPLYPSMEVGSFLSFIADIRQLKGVHRAKRMEKVVAQMELEDVWFQPIETLSKGFIRRVGIAQALLHDPEILILDEPTDGLDPNQKHHVRSLIKALATEKLVVVSTHILEEVRAVCTRAIIINQGKKIVDETPEALEKRSRFYRAVSIHFAPQVDMTSVFSTLQKQPELMSYEFDGLSHLRILSKNKETILPRVAELIRHHGWAIEDFYAEKGSLEDVFRQLTENDTRFVAEPDMSIRKEEVA